MANKSVGNTKKTHFFALFKKKYYICSVKCYTPHFTR